MEIETYIPKLPELNNTQSVFLEYVNKERKNRGVDILIPEKLLTQYAVHRILNIADKPNFSHDSDWFKIKFELEQRGFTMVSELLSKKHNSVWSVFNNYMKSKDGHGEALMDGRYKYIGLGVVNYNHKIYSCIILTNYNII